MSKYAIVFRLLVAIIAGGVIGYERENNRRPAGLRTHILVCVGACIISMLQISLVEDSLSAILANPSLTSVLKVDMSRLGAQVITGVGFLGAGTIVHEKGLVKGLTTAASIWVVACIGLVAGMGYYFLAFFSTFVVYLILECLKVAEYKYIDKNRKIKIQVFYNKDNNSKSDLYEIFRKNKIGILSLEYKSYTKEKEIDEESNNNLESCIYCITIPPKINTLELVDSIIDSKKFVKVKVI